LARDPLAGRVQASDFIKAPKVKLLWKSRQVCRLVTRAQHEEKLLKGSWPGHRLIGSVRKVNP
jgi:hypothetical protein